MVLLSRVSLPLVEIRLAGLGRYSVLQLVAGDTCLNKIRKFFTCLGEVLGLG